jgi:glucose-1-phosphate adenylyltransferase
MGIYVAAYADLQRILDNELADFGSDILPALAASNEPVYAYDFSKRNRIEDYIYVFEGGRRIKERTPCVSDSSYWRDVGTLDAYWLANMDLVAANPPFNLYGEIWPFFNSPVHFPPSKFVHEGHDRTGAAMNSIVADGVIISGATVRQSVLGPGLYLHSYTHVDNSVLLGGGMRQGIWAESTIMRGCRIRNAIVDKMVTIGEQTTIGYDRADDERRGLTTQTIGNTAEYVVAVPRGASL